MKLRGLIPAHAGKTSRGRARTRRVGAHPRSRGENFDVTELLVRNSGSSPLTRGKLGGTAPWEVLHGLIPAHAGKTAARRLRRECPRAHPRSRGENQGLVTNAVTWMGSSPLTRGKPAATARAKEYAEAHPRSRGENRPNDSHSPEIAGSSPLTRGKRSWQRYLVTAFGLIPAHAGKTASPKRAQLSEAAHPRSRGENLVARGRGNSRRGSSPLTRGKPVSMLSIVDLLRLIPAHAGKTTCSWSPRRTLRAHPRSRGENSRTVPRRYRRRGSSPLTRGKRTRIRSMLRTLRLIPAHAGKTRPWPRPMRPTRAHPRSRGENSAPSSPRSATCGSSPLTRGKPRSHR